ncbi:hypothetical protein Tco_1520322 [Tanacetum coccineum]
MLGGLYLYYKEYGLLVGIKTRLTRCCKGSHEKKPTDTTKETVDVFEESDPEPTKKQTASRRVVKKNVTITADDNIIPKPGVALELGKSISLIEAAEEEAARQVHATHVRIVTKPVR